MRHRDVMKQRTRSASSVSESRDRTRRSLDKELALALLTALLTLAITGCLTLMGGEQKVGDAAARQVEAEMGIVQDVELAAWVSEIGRRLVAVTDDPDRPFRFQIVDMADPNAFALPGGHIYVSRGLLSLVNSEDELAGVIGHEIGHVVGSHASRRITLAAPFTIIAGLTGWVTGILTPRVGKAIRDGGNTLTDGLVVAPFGRQQERAADRIGLKLAAAAGWKPEGLSDFLHTLGRDGELRSGGKRRTSWLDTHPATPERVEDTLKLAAKLEQADLPPIAKDRDSLLTKLDGLLVGDDVAGGTVVDNLFIHPEIGFTLRVPRGWGYRNAQTQFIAAPKDGGAAIVLRLLAEGDDPATLKPELEKALGKEVDSHNVSLGGLPGIRMRIDQKTGQGRMTMDVIYFAVSGLILEVAGIAPEKDYERWSGLFDAAILAVRPPTASEIAALTEERLRTARARSKESLDQFVERTSSAWSSPRVAVTNGIDKDAVTNGIDKDASLAEGFGIKIMREEAYTPRSE